MDEPPFKKQFLPSMYNKQYIPLRRTSQFLALPRELRKEIYTHLFTSTRLRFGARENANRSKVFVKPAAHALAILHVCRQTNLETRDLWPSLVFFDFLTIPAMMDKLIPLSLTTRRKLRYMRIQQSVYELYVTFLQYGCNVLRPNGWILAVDAFNLLKDLQLDVLTIVHNDSSFNVFHVDELIQRGHGWKKLVILLKNSEALSHNIHRREAAEQNSKFNRPGKWHRAMQKRDGGDLGAEVRVYQSWSEDVGSILLPDGRLLDRDDCRHEAWLMLSEYREGYFKKELMVVVTRGKNTEITLPHVFVPKGRLGWYTPTRRDPCWKEILEQCLPWDRLDHEEYDVYLNPDEIDQNQWAFDRERERTD
jgi:hypothetical protein